MLTFIIFIILINRINKHPKWYTVYLHRWAILLCPGVSTHHLLSLTHKPCLVLRVAGGLSRTAAGLNSQHSLTAHNAFLGTEALTHTQ